MEQESKVFVKKEFENCEGKQTLNIDDTELSKIEFMDSGPSMQETLNLEGIKLEQEDYAEVDSDESVNEENTAFVGELNNPLINVIKKRYKMIQMENCEEKQTLNKDDSGLSEMEFVDCGLPIQETVNLEAVKLEREEVTSGSVKEENTKYVGEVNKLLINDIKKRFKLLQMKADGVSLINLESEGNEDVPRNYDELLKEEINIDVNTMCEAMKGEDTDSCNIGTDLNNEERQIFEDIGNSCVTINQREELLEPGLSITDVNSNIPTPTGDQLFSCNNCNKSFTRKGNLLRHMRSIHTGERPFSCNNCNKSFSEKANLLDHMLTHTGERPFCCNYCNQSYARKMTLLNHLRSHTGERPFSCNNCYKSFHLRSTLLRHMRTHTGERPFSCNTCNRSFTRKSHLLNHLRTHTGERPFSCNNCNKSFPLRSTLLRHMNTHTGERFFSCNNCNKSFHLRSALLRHMRTHTGERPFSCNTCNTSFTRKSHLLNHLRTHTGERPFSCNNCNKSFPVRSTLLRHMNTHTGERPFSCNTCYKSFTWKTVLESNAHLNR